VPANEPTLERLHIDTDNLGAMRRMAVEHERHRPPAVAHDGFEMIDL
jgi:hypothetical protein